MSLITRCPTCETMFKVVPDQLRVSEGWVRCGQCTAIFDATQNMVPSPGTEMAAAPVVPTPPAAQAPVPAPETTRQAPPAQATTQSFFVRPAEPTAPQRPADVLPESLPAASIDDDKHRNAAPPTDPDTVFLDQEPDPEPRTQPQTPDSDPVDLPLPSATPWQAPVQTEAVLTPDDPPVTFLRESEKPSIWRKPAVRWSLALVALALVALLIMQVVRMERDRIAAVEPATRPLLLALCEWTGCVLAPLRQIESVVIDSSSFSRVRGDEYRLGFAFRNTASIAIAMPSIEISLTDPQDQAVIRRVIQPAEFGAGALPLAKASVWSGSLALSVRPGTHTDRIAGYRLLAFYP